jgi:hypothetical protein
VWDERNQWIKDGISPRVAEHALRCAYICASVDGRPDLRASELKPALAMARYRIRTYLRPNPGQNPARAIAIREWLEKNNPGEWVRRLPLSRAFCERVGPMIFNQTLMHLGMNDEVEVDAKRKIVDCPQYGDSGDSLRERATKVQVSPRSVLKEREAFIDQVYQQLRINCPQLSPRIWGQLKQFLSQS